MIKEILINRFDGGISNDLRSKIANKFALTKHFDVFTYSHKLAPNFSSVETTGAGSEDVKDYLIKRFLYESASGTNYVFARGKNKASTVARIYRFNTATLKWEGLVNGEAVDAAADEVFFHYQGYLYMWLGGNNLARYDITDANPFDNIYKQGVLLPSILYTSVVQPVLHPGKNNVYFINNNTTGPHIHELADSTFSVDCNTGFSTDLKITAACAYGNYLALAITDAKEQKSTVNLWDMDITLNDFTEKIDFGYGKIIHLATLNNRLTAIMTNYPKLLIKQYDGEKVVIINELVCAGSSFSTFSASNQTVNDKIYFPMDLDNDAGDRMGIWACDGNGNLSNFFEIEGATSYEGIFLNDNVWYVSHSSGSVAKSLTTYSSTLPSVYNSLIIGDSYQNKKLLSVGVMTEPYNASYDGQIILKYRLRESDSWTTIYTYTASTTALRDVPYHEAINIESTGANLPTFREIQFRIEAYASAAITGLKIKYEELDTNPG